MSLEIIIPYFLDTGSKSIKFPSKGTVRLGLTKELVEVGLPRLRRTNIRPSIEANNLDSHSDKELMLNTFNPFNFFMQLYSDDLTFFNN